MLASGFLDPSQNSNGPAFGLYVASPAGGALLALPSVPLSVNEFDSTQFAIFPNPATERININAAGIDLSQYSVTITDMLGRVVSSGAINIDNTIDVNYLSEGVYNLTILDGNSVVVSKKFVKN